MVGSCFSLKVACRRNELHKVEGFVEDICDFHNIFNVYFGNILVATCEYFSFLESLFPLKEVELFSHLKEGALVVGFKLAENFEGAAPYCQKDISGYIESDDISEKERSYLSAALLSDDVFLDSIEQTVELRFNIKAEASQRGKIISEYIESMAIGSGIKSAKEK